MSNKSKLSDFISIKHGFAFKGEFISTEENENCLLTPGNFAIGGGFKSDKFKFYTGNVPSDYILNSNDLIVTMTDLSKDADTLGYSALVPNIQNKQMLHNQRIGLVIFINDELDKEYLYFLMRSKEYRHHVVSTATGSTVKHTSPSKILSFEFDKPTLEQQKKIAKYLLSFENKIQLNTQTNQTLEQIAQAIFKSWFVDFDPVKAKINALANGGTHVDAERAAMQIISGKTDAELTQMQQTTPAAYKTLEKTAALFPSEMVESELGDVPKGWLIQPIKDFGEIICGKTPSKQKQEYYEGNIPFIKIPDMHSNIFITETNEYLSELGANSQPRKFLPKGSICVSCIATVGKVSIVSKLSQTNQQINSIKPYNKVYSEYLYFYMLSLKETFIALASAGSATLNMNTTTFSNVKILNPQIELISHFKEIIGVKFDRILGNQLEINTLSRIRDSLLPNLLSGNLNID
ncbi:restriction endonuclease subunit S [Pasteurella multocida]|uniref:restriction endonuclease subunit S n=1 Tax=Pasteurella multocida TaxID=747 RepID=UPI000BBCFA58|nr:restriction endonuclease subunit S [Pasteurella multocida]ATF74940.1 restriction endonuclease subunit S [Pasteurella multocida]ATN17342.1 restriction endonuclease subunit S [Pasteurella multocida]HDR1385832.1 restriction endonuclease subunit S [Pasteurella multocida]